jgi:hypothetical protein
MIAEKGWRRGTNIQEQVVIPASVEDPPSLRRWRLSDDTPTSGELTYLGPAIWAGLSMKVFSTHNPVKAAFEYPIMSVVQAEPLGRYVPDRLLRRSGEAELSTEPDGLFFA